MPNTSVKSFFDATTNTVSYIFVDLDTRKCAVIDSVLDFDQASGRTSTKSADLLCKMVEENRWEVTYIFETHVHADHLSAAPYLKDKVGGQIAIGAGIVQVQDVFGKVFNEGSEFQRDGSQFDVLLEDGDTFAIGTARGRAIHTPGHTPACMTYVIEDAAFVGDTLFMPDFGTARTDFPGGDAATLYHSIQKIFALPDQTRVFTAHDYLAPGRENFRWESTVAEQSAKNVHVGQGQDEASFVSMRNARDAQLGMPKLILPSVQVNMRAGNPPAREDNGTAYLKIPIDAL